jgi:ribosomal protein S18 acetylase RimI-like enzyme
LKLRAANETEFDVLLPLVRQYHEFEGIMLSDEARCGAISQLLENESYGKIWLICAQNEVVGYIALCFGFSIEFCGRDAFVDEFFILEPFRGRGMGKTALEKIKSEAQAMDIKALHLEVSRSNHRAKALYASLNFASRERYNLMSCEFSAENTFQEKEDHRRKNPANGQGN